MTSEFKVVSLPFLCSNVVGTECVVPAPWQPSAGCAYVDLTRRPKKGIERQRCCKPVVFSDRCREHIDSASKIEIIHHEEAKLLPDSKTIMAYSSHRLVPGTEISNYLTTGLWGLVAGYLTEDAQVTLMHLLAPAWMCELAVAGIGPRGVSNIARTGDIVMMSKWLDLNGQLVTPRYDSDTIGEIFTECVRAAGLDNLSVLDMLLSSDELEDPNAYEIESILAPTVTSANFDTFIAAREREEVGNVLANLDLELLAASVPHPEELLQKSSWSPSTPDYCRLLLENYKLVALRIAIEQGSTLPENFHSLLSRVIVSCSMPSDPNMKALLKSMDDANMFSPAIVCRHYRPDKLGSVVSQATMGDNYLLA